MHVYFQPGIGVYAAPWDFGYTLGILCIQRRAMLTWTFNASLTRCTSSLAPFLSFYRQFLVRFNDLLKQLAYWVQPFLGGEDVLGYLELDFWVLLEVSVKLGIEEL
jgi:hypothetical protein